MVTGALPSKHTVVPRRSQGTKAARGLLEKKQASSSPALSPPTPLHAQGGMAVT